MAVTASAVTTCKGFFFVVLRLRLNGVFHLQGSLFSLSTLGIDLDTVSDSTGYHSPIHSFNSARYSSSSSAKGEGFQIKLGDTMILSAMEPNNINE